MVNMDDSGACTTTEMGCTVSATCASGTAGVGTNLMYTFTVGNDSASGTEHISDDIAFGDASITVDCTYSLSLTKN
jgi:hypothetical protein